MVKKYEIRGIITNKEIQSNTKLNKRHIAHIMGIWS